ncbi:TraJ transfer ATPase [Escherichia coli]|uniref:TraJ transfer ATPase n=1 Tax=Escherichia coli TaxID=562 RepID=A0A376VWG4_ECOLX|nr:TraJ transfer ATPase [Escherichia coli]
MKIRWNTFWAERMTFCLPIRPKSGAMWKVLRQDFALPFAVTRTSSVSVKSGIMKRQMQPSRQVTPVTSASAPCTPNHPVKTFARLLGLFPPEIRDSMAAATLSLVQFILVQVLVRTNDGGRQAVREYIVITDELRDTLSGSPMRHGGITLMKSFARKNGGYGIRF